MTDAIDSFTASMRGEFIDETGETLNSLDIITGNLRSGQEKSEASLPKLRGMANGLKNSAAAAGFPLVQLVMHRLGDYLEALKDTPAQALDDIQQFSDKARQLIAASAPAIDSAELVRQLPAKRYSFDVKDVALPNPVEVLMVIKEKTAGMLFERELRACGLRVNMLQNSFEAIEMAVRTKPDYIIISGVLDELSGIDLCSAFAAMPTTQKIPVSLLTSMDANSPELKKLPASISLIRKNHFGDDLANALAKHSIL